MGSNQQFQTSNPENDVANRLLRTETNYVTNQAEAEAYEEAGISKYRYMAVLDGRTSDICQEQDGKEYNLDEKQVGVNFPPLHPWCRSNTEPVIDGLVIENQTRWARDPVTGEDMKVSRDMSYHEWNARLNETRNPDIIHLLDDSVGRSVGAKARNYDIYDPLTGKVFSYAEGTTIQNREVFAGYRTKTPLKEAVAEGLSKRFGGDERKWQHAKGIGIIDDEGDHVRAEVHWFQEETVGQVLHKIKKWLE